MSLFNWKILIVLTVNYGSRFFDSKLLKKIWIFISMLKGVKKNIILNLNFLQYIHKKTQITNLW